MRKFIACLSLILLLADPSFAVAEKGSQTRPRKSKPAELKISGYGFLGDRELKRLLRVLLSTGKKPEVYSADWVEDAALILASKLGREGYLEPQITAELTLEDGHQLDFEWRQAMNTPLPRPLRIRKAHFRIRKGVLYYYKALQFQGLQTIKEKQARSFFVETGLLFRLKRYRSYTPEKLRQGLSSLKDVLARRGYEQASAVAAQLSQDDKTGAVKALIQVQQGRKSVVHSVREEFFFGTETEPAEVRTVLPDKPYSKLWEQDFTQALKTNSYHRGYPDTKVEVQRLKEQTSAGLVLLDLLVEIHSGDKIKLGKVDFEGQKKTKLSLLRQRVRLQEGSLLDRIKVEQGRYRLAQLGIFDSVDLNYEPESELVRDVSYHLKEAKRTDLSLLFGFGSYELVRGGIELERRNILGLAHHVRLKLVQSFKASSGEFVYTIPEFIGRDVDLFFNGTALRRQEVSFLREEYGGGAGAHKNFKELATDLSVRYNYQILNAEQANGFVATEGVRNPAVGSVITDLRHDRRDSPLYPHSGYKVFSNIESATEYLGGDVNYERVDIATSYHQPLGGGRWLHLGLSHGAAIPQGSSSNNLPFTRRFFPGGENSIRGYQEGRASPRDTLGNFVGAETYLLGSVEFEQALTPKWSLVLFSDSLGEAQRIQHYPLDTVLYSVGAGFNWRTVIGPVRLEYGYNLNPRHADPSGTVNFSFGFPF
jgi:outer membrane protein assembly complex protein YaeT